MTSERYKSPCPLPNDHERELLIKFMEECCEVAQRVSKLILFGAKEVEPGQSLDNIQRLSLEVGDFLEVRSVVQGMGFIDQEFVNKGREIKRAKLKRYVQTDAHFDLHNISGGVSFIGNQ